AGPVVLQIRGEDLPWDRFSEIAVHGVLRYTDNLNIRFRAGIPSKPEAPAHGRCAAAEVILRELLVDDGVLGSAFHLRLRDLPPFLRARLRPVDLFEDDRPFVRQGEFTARN